MTSNKKYDFTVAQIGETWTAKITRKVSSQKRVTTKEQADFSSEAEALEWAQASLLELTEKLKSSNEAHGVKRKDSEQVRSERSARRASKTEQAKLAAAEAEKQKADDIKAVEAMDSDELDSDGVASDDLSSEALDDEVAYDFDEDEGSSE